MPDETRDPFAAERASYDRNDPIALRGRIYGLEQEIIKLRGALVEAATSAASAHARLDRLGGWIA